MTPHGWQIDLSQAKPGQQPLPLLQGSPAAPQLMHVLLTHWRSLQLLPLQHG
jgi:hypothetical protein